MPSHRADPQVSRRHGGSVATSRRAVNAHRPSQARAAILTPHQGITVYDTDELYAAVYGTADTYVPSSFTDGPSGSPARRVDWWEAIDDEPAPPQPVVREDRVPLSPSVPAEPTFAESMFAEPRPAEPALTEPMGVMAPLTPVTGPSRPRAGAAPLTRAQLRAAQGPLTSKGAALPSRASRRAAERAKPKKSSLSVSQVGIASALGLATIAAPLAGALATPAAKTTSDPLPAIGADAGPIAMFPRVLAPEANAVEEAKLVPGLNESASLPKTLAAPREIFVTRASRGSERAILPGCDGEIPAGANWQNGRIPAGDLCTLWDKSQSLRADAAVALAKLNMAYKKRFGSSICLTDSYRNLNDQYRLRAIKPGLAAVPGTSQHGWGLAVDLCGGIENYGSVTYRWMRANAPAYGWDNPDWALPGGSGPTEPWHWEYLAGEKVGPGSE